MEGTRNRILPKGGLSAKFKGRWGLKSLSVVDVQIMHASLDVLRGENTEVPKDGVLWVFALKR